MSVHCRDHLKANCKFIWQKTLLKRAQVSLKYFKRTSLKIDIYFRKFLWPTSSSFSVIMSSIQKCLHTVLLSEDNFCVRRKKEGSCGTNDNRLRLEETIRLFIAFFRSQDQVFIANMFPHQATTRRRSSYKKWIETLEQNLNSLMKNAFLS